MLLTRKLFNRVWLGLALASTLTACTTAAAPEPRVSVVPMLHSDYAVMDDGYRLPLARWAPEDEPKAVAIALHGFNDYHRAFAGVGPELARQGILTLAYDQRGFGETEQRGYWAGTQRMVHDVRTMVALARAQYPDLPLYLVGESMGGAVTMTALASSEAPEVDGAVLIAPAVWGRTTMPWYQRAGLWLARHVAPDWRPTGRGLGRIASDNRDMLRALGRDPLVIKKTRIETVAGLADLMDKALVSAPRIHVPTLMLYGANDQIVPKLPTCRMLSSVPEHSAWKIGLYPQGYHMLTRDLQGERVVSDIASWILHPQAALPSGHQAVRADWQQVVCGQPAATMVSR